MPARWASLLALVAIGGSTAPGDMKHSDDAVMKAARTPQKEGKTDKEPKKKHKELGLNEFQEELEKVDPELSKKSPTELLEFLLNNTEELTKFREKLGPDMWGRLVGDGVKANEEQLEKNKTRSDAKGARFALYKARPLAKALRHALTTDAATEDIEVAVAALPAADGFDPSAVRARMGAVMPALERHAKDVIAKHGFDKLGDAVHTLFSTENRTTDRAFSENMAVIHEVVTGTQRPSRAGRHLRLDDIAVRFVGMGAAGRASAIAEVEMLREEVLAGVTGGLTVQSADMYLDTMRRIVQKETYAEDAVHGAIVEMGATQRAREEFAPTDLSDAPTELARRVAELACRVHILSAFILDDERLEEAKRRRAPAEVEAVTAEEEEGEGGDGQQKTLLVRRNPDGKKGFRFKGTTVTAVQSGWAEEAAGMKSGMVIVRFADKPVRDEEELSNVKVPRGSAGQYPIVVKVMSQKQMQKQEALLSSTDADVRKMPVRKLQNLLRAAGIPARNIVSDPIRLVQEAVRVVREHRAQKGDM